MTTRVLLLQTELRSWTRCSITKETQLNILILYVYCLSLFTMFSQPRYGPFAVCDRACARASSCTRVRVNYD